MFGLWLNYANDPLVAVRNGVEVGKIQPGVLGVDLTASIAFLNRLQLGVVLPATGYQWLNLESGVYSDPSRLALNDVRVDLKLQLLNPDRSAIGLALEPRFWLPTGSSETLTGGQFNAGGALVIDKRVGRGWIGGNLLYRYRPALQSAIGLEIDDELLYRLGVVIPMGQSFLVGDLWGGAGAARLSDGQVGTKPLELMLGISRSLKRGATVTFGASTGLVAGYGVPDFRLLASVVLGSRVQDRDGDGIEDRIDRCPDVPEDKDGIDDLDGCPEIEPDGDRDGDGILDSKDKCPDEPEDKDGFEDLDGCPDPDNDQDRILDKDDKCPIDPEDKDGFEDLDGCPELDNDQDGFLDTKDKCPNIAETFNKFEDDDGCPDVLVAEPTKIKVVEGKLMLLQKIYFEFDKDVIMPQSYQILNAAAQVFKDNPDLRVRIEGHTDAMGTDEYNQSLSQRRADSVRNYMIERGGLSPSRFEAVGYGESRSLETNDTEEGRALNRRIEWIIID